MLLATVLVWAVAVVTTGEETIGTWDTARSGPERPVMSPELLEVSTP